MITKLQSKARVIIVSSGGMLTNKLNSEDFNFEKMNPFDGTMAYAQNKRQQIVMTEQYASKYPNIFFASMHPGTVMTNYIFGNENRIPEKLGLSIFFNVMHA